MPVHVLGWLARSDKARSHVLYTGRRHGDVTLVSQNCNHELLPVIEAKEVIYVNDGLQMSRYHDV